MTVRQVVERLRALGDPRVRASWKRDGLDPWHCLGTPLADVRALARELGRDHPLALSLWETGLHEARLLATMVADPALVEDELLDAWVAGADHQQLSDRVARRVAMATIYARAKVADWKDHPRVLVRRSAYVLLAELATRDRKMTDADFVPHIDAIQTFIHGEAACVREAMCHALERISRRNAPLHVRSLAALRRLAPPIARRGFAEDPSARSQARPDTDRVDAADWRKQRTG